MPGVAVAVVGAAGATETGVVGRVCGAAGGAAIGVAGAGAGAAGAGAGAVGTVGAVTWVVVGGGCLPPPPLPPSCNPPISTPRGLPISGNPISFMRLRIASAVSPMVPLRSCLLYTSPSPRD